MSIFTIILVIFAVIKAGEGIGSKDVTPPEGLVLWSAARHALRHSCSVRCETLQAVECTLDLAFFTCPALLIYLGLLLAIYTSVLRANVPLEVLQVVLTTDFSRCTNDIMISLALTSCTARSAAATNYTLKTTLDQIKLKAFVTIRIIV